MGTFVVSLLVLVLSVPVRGHAQTSQSLTVLEEPPLARRGGNPHRTPSIGPVQESRR